MNFKQKLISTKSLKRNGVLDTLLSYIYVTQHQKFISKNLIILLSDILVTFFEKFGFTKQETYIRD